MLDIFFCLGLCCIETPNLNYFYSFFAQFHYQEHFRDVFNFVWKTDLPIYFMVYSGQKVNIGKTKNKINFNIFEVNDEFLLQNRR